ncbi:hypothetical protein [Moraxella cuniculi]|nr:hypothetical protein [Moraxella cuniculi]
MSINMSEVGDIMNRDLEITLNEIILDELQQTFLDWYDSAECAIECHFLEFG